uniref:Ribonuclease H-like domain-containing protein n=1 Tax=Tanacetum cinerariifolium TaxID=118510 RepID=A0A6L2JEP5_TANCI|nr:ribonuclease H-like domain-containing protein [Tanacetum cinerariifolium]
MSLDGYSDGEYDDGNNVDNVTLISKLDVSHPLHLHPNDSVALTVVSVKLKGTENYQVWSCSMLHALEGKNKTGFIDGSSRRCTCHAADDFKKHNQLMKLMQFLMGLDDTYMQISSSIISKETLPDVKSAYVIISSEESHRIATGSVSRTSQRYPADFKKRKVGLNFKRKNVSNNAIGSMLEKHQLTGLNFNEWFRALKLVVRIEKLQDVFKTAFPPAPAAGADAQALADWAVLFYRHNEVACLMLGTMSSKLYQQFEHNSPL